MGTQQHRKTSTAGKVPAELSSAEYVAEIAARMSEADLLTNVMDAAKKLGWRSYHARPARTTHGWRTPVQGDRAGFPDLILLRGDRMLAVELKRELPDVPEAQAAWLEAFMRVDWVEVEVWRPSDWLSGEIEAELLR